jgi:hypothetical protein
MKLSISLQFKIEKLLGGQPMLIFASDVWATIDINPALQISYLSLTVCVVGKLFNLGQDPSKCT